MIADGVGNILSARIADRVLRRIDRSHIRLWFAIGALRYGERQQVEADTRMGLADADEL